MKFALPKFLCRPSTLGIAFIPIPLILALFYPASFWAISDYQPHSLADALNMAYRLADLKMYTPMGMSYHPGGPFYLMSWLALALIGHPLGSDGIGLFNALADHIETFQLMMIFLAGIAGAAGIFVFARSAQKLVPADVTISGLALWLFSLPATILTFVSPGIESFALLINGLFFAVLARLAYEPTVGKRIVILAGCIGALAYLNKLAYVYIPIALFAAIVVNWFQARTGAGRKQPCWSSLCLVLRLSGSPCRGFASAGQPFATFWVFHKQVSLARDSMEEAIELWSVDPQSGRH